MNAGRKLVPIATKGERALSTLVENRTAITLEHCELNVFETHQQATSVNLAFGDLVLTSMLRGKKVMHLFGKPGFEYLPGESVIVPPGEVMQIDFPEAGRDNPTQCIALAISADQIHETINLLNERLPTTDAHDAWRIDTTLFHFSNNAELADTINRLIRISIKDHTPQKDALAGLALRELLLRLMQTQARGLLEQNYLQLAAGNPFAYVLKYIKENLRERIDPDALHEKASMSRASFYRKFRDTYGIAPGEYILQERMRLAMESLRNPFITVSEACYAAGFQSLNHFIRQFRKETGLTPKAYQRSVAGIE